MREPQFHRTDASVGEFWADILDLLGDLAQPTAFLSTEGTCVMRANRQTAVK